MTDIDPALGAAITPADGFKVQRRMCRTCIYRPDTHFDIEHLESQCREKQAVADAAPVVT